jgi:type IVB pilus formation R64 PilN family outer membrane protein
MLLNLLNGFIIGGLTLGLFGCSITGLPDGVQKNIAAADGGVNAANQKIHSQKNITNSNFVTYSDTAYFGSNVIQLKNSATLPKVFSDNVSVDKYFGSLTEIADTINRLTGIPAYVDQNGNGPAGNNMGNNMRPIRVTQQFGTLTDMLDSLAAKTDTSWTYRNGKIILSQLDAQTWTVKLIPGNVQVQNQVNNNSGITGTAGGGTQSISGDGGGMGGSGGSSVAKANQSTIQNIAFNLEGDVWKNFELGIKQLLSHQGKMSINPQTSSVTVMDKPSVLSKVDEYIKIQNDIMKRVVQVDVQVLSVETKAEDNYGINWNLVLNGSNATFSVNGQTSQIGSNGITAFKPSPIFVPTNTTQAFTVGVPANSGVLSGSQLILNALSSLSKVSNITSTAATTLSNQPVPINFTDQVSYLASVQNTISGQSSLSQQSLTPGQITIGFSLNILPVIEDDGMIRMQLSLNLSNLKQMAQYSTEGASIQLPTIGNRSFMQKVAMRDGDTFVVTSFDSSLDNLFQNGVGGVKNWWFGGGVSASKNKSRLVILITPHIINS